VYPEAILCGWEESYPGLYRCIMLYKQILSLRIEIFAVCDSEVRTKYVSQMHIKCDLK